MNLSDEANKLFEYSRSLRRDFHRNPELGFKEVRTAGIIEKELRQLDLKVIKGIGKTGIIGLLEGSFPGPVVLVRFDMDALPIQEESELDYASQVPGVMHACGHDGHVAIGLTVARLLKPIQPMLHGMVKLVFQPAEEGLGGAAHMIADGVLENPVPDYALALHLWNEISVGHVALVPGPMMAGSGFFSLKIIGKGGHGALPQNAIDPIFAGSQIVSAVQSIISRNISPLQSAVVSFTQFRSGDAYNVIPQRAELKGTIRFFDKSVQAKIMERLEKIIKGVSASMDCEIEFSLNDATPAVVNDLEVTRRLNGAFLKVMPEIIIQPDFRTMVSEDMGKMLEIIPGCYFMVGSGNSEKGLNIGHHNPKFDFDESVLPAASTLMTAAVLELTGTN